MAHAIDPKMFSSIRRADSSVRLACALAIAVAMVEIALDLGTWVELDIASIYGIPLVAAAFTRNRRLLWGLMVALTLATFIAYALQIPAGAFRLREALFVNRALDAVALLVTAGLVQVWMTSMDVRERQAKLLTAHEAQIVRQNEELILRRHEAEEASGRKTRLLNAVSHDIRNPVNTISLMAEVIRRTAADPARSAQVSEMARSLQSSAQSLVALVSEVLDIAHLDSGLLQRHESIFSLNDFIEAKNRDLAPLADAKSLRLESDTPEQIVRVRADRIKLDRIITNLVTNAIKFTSNGSVTIGAGISAGDAVVIRVRDTGIGIPDHEIENIFDEFSRFNVPLGKLNGGWGLGLAISRRLANFIGATISVESELGRGTVFTVLLPAGCVVDIAPVVLPGAS
jgi:signal transduction histidine kinase